MAISDTLRNDLFLTLVKGEFEKGAKSAPKNIEVRVYIVDKHGKELEVSSFDFCFVHFCICINIAPFCIHFLCCCFFVSDCAQPIHYDNFTEMFVMFWL